MLGHNCWRKKPQYNLKSKQKEIAFQLETINAKHMPK